MWTVPSVVIRYFTAATGSGTTTGQSAPAPPSVPEFGQAAAAEAAPGSKRASAMSNFALAASAAASILQSFDTT